MSDLEKNGNKLLSKLKATKNLDDESKREKLASLEGESIRLIVQSLEAIPGFKEDIESLGTDVDLESLIRDYLKEIIENNGDLSSPNIIGEGFFRYLDKRFT